MVSKQKLSPVKGKVISRLEKKFVLKPDLIFILKSIIKQA